MSVATIISSLVILIIIQRMTKNIILAILGAVGTIVLFRFDPEALLNAFIIPLKDPDLYKLLGTVFFIYLFSHALDLSGDAKRFAASSKALFDDRTSMAFMPMMRSRPVGPTTAIVSPPRMFSEISFNTGSPAL